QLAPFGPVDGGADDGPDGAQAAEPLAHDLDDLGSNDMGPQEELRPLRTPAGAATRGRRRGLEVGRRSTVTMRLDPRRQMMLRLASTVKNRSAQQVMTAALDQYLADIPEIETLAAQAKRDRHDR